MAIKTRKSVMAHSFSKVPRAEIPRSSFDRSHGHKTAFDGGLLIPIFVDEALPGDTFNLSMTAFARLATPIFPLMDNMRMSFFFFAIPHRLLWVNWEKFCGARDDPADDTDFTIPTKSLAAGVAEESLLDYMGIPPIVTPTSLEVSALPLRAYVLCYNEWFRDENIQDSIVMSTADGPDTTTVADIQSRGKRFDYFTSCLPWPQKGDSVDLPLGTRAEISGLGIPAAGTFPNADGTFKDATTTAAGEVYPFWASTVGDTWAMRGSETGASGIPDVYADLSDATAATINQLRQAFQIQKLLERDARGGTRYTEVIKAHFGVTSPDARLQRPEYLGGGTAPVVISAVPNTSSTATENQGELSGFGTVNGRNIGFTKSFTEHCVLLGVVSVQADLTYQQGIDRMWKRSTRYDFYWPALSHIGEQAVLGGEIWTEGEIAGDTSVFGYQERFAEYRFKNSRISGIFRSDHSATLDSWHLAQDFATRPTLSNTFMKDTPPIARVIAVSSERHFLFDSYFSMRCARPMPMYGVPGLIDHF